MASPTITVLVTGPDRTGNALVADIIMDALHEAYVTVLGVASRRSLDELQEAGARLDATVAVTSNP